MSESRESALLLGSKEGVAWARMWERREGGRTSKAGRTTGEDVIL